MGREVVCLEDVVGWDVAAAGWAFVAGVRWKLTWIGTERTRRCGRGEGDVDMLTSHPSLTLNLAAVGELNAGGIVMVDVLSWFKVTPIFWGRTNFVGVSITFTLITERRLAARPPSLLRRWVAIDQIIALIRDALRRNTGCIRKYCVFPSRLTLYLAFGTGVRNWTMRARYNGQ